MRGLKLIHRAAEELRKHSGELTEEMMIDQFGSANSSAPTPPCRFHRGAWHER